MTVNAAPAPVMKALIEQNCSSQAKVKQTMRGNRTNCRNVCENATKPTAEQWIVFGAESLTQPDVHWDVASDFVTPN